MEIFFVLIVGLGYFFYQCSHCVDQFIELVINEASLSEALAEWNDIVDWEVQKYCP